MFYKFSSFLTLALAIAGASSATAGAVLKNETSPSTGAVQAVPVTSDGHVNPIPNLVSLVELCIDANLIGCSVILFSAVPTGCLSLLNVGGSSAFQDSVSSVEPIDGIQCILFQDIGCAGRSIEIGGIINDLSAVNFNDAASSMSCVAN